MVFTGFICSESSKGGVREGGVAQTCRELHAKLWSKLRVFRFVHQRKCVRDGSESVSNQKIKFGQFYANTPFPMPPSPISDLF